MGEGYNAEVRPVSGTAADIAGHLQAMADAGATHVQLVVDPITVDSIEKLGDVLAALDHGRTAAA
jgi:hypothetical protein